MAAWLIMPPVSVTVAWILPKIGAQRRRRERGHQDLALLHLADLVGGEDDPGKALDHAGRGSHARDSTPSSPAPPPSHALVLSDVMPHSMTVKGSVMTSGGTPSAGVGFHFDRAAWMPRRRSISGGQ